MVLLPHFIWNCGFTRLNRKRLTARGLASQNTHSSQMHLAYWGVSLQSQSNSTFQESEACKRSAPPLPLR